MGWAGHRKASGYNTHSLSYGTTKIKPFKVQDSSLISKSTPSMDTADMVHSPHGVLLLQFPCVICFPKVGPEYDHFQR